MTHRRYFGLLLSLLAVVCVACGQRESPPKEARELGLEFVKDIPLGGSASRFDYQSIDSAARRLFVAHLGADMVSVVEVDSLVVVKEIRGVPRPHGILAVPGLGRVYVSATGVDRVFAIDERTLEIRAKIPSGHYPDGIAYHPALKRLFVSDETGKTVAVIEAMQEKFITKIEMGGEVGNTQYDPVSGLIYSAVQTRNEIVQIDPDKMTVAARFPLPECDSPHGFYIDASTHYAFITGEGNGGYVVFDLSTKSVIASGHVGDDPDVLAFDRGMSRLYVSSESGVVSTFDLRAGGVTKTGEALFAPNAHSVSVDQRTHRVFFPLQNIGGRPVLRVMKPASTAK